MAALNTDLLKKLSRRWVGQIGAAGVSDASVTTIPLSATTNLATDTAVVATIDRVDSNGDASSALEETIIGVVSGSNLVTCTRGVEGTAQAHAAGAVVEILVTAKGWNDLVDHLLVQHNQLGGHTNITACNVTASGTTTASHVTASDITARSVTASEVSPVFGSDAQGDVYYRNSSGKLARLGPGTSGQFLKTLGAAANPAWANAPGAAFFVVPYTDLGFDRNASVLYNGLAEKNLTTSEAIHQLNLPAGTIGELRLRVTTNTMSAGTVIRVRVNGANAGPVITVGAGLTGSFSDTTSVTIVAGDLVCLSLDSTASGVGNHIDIQSIITKFIAS
jgi:hypothetical protein